MHVTTFYQYLIGGACDSLPGVVLAEPSYCYIYVFDAFTEKPCSKPLERNVLDIPIITSSRATPLTSKYYISDVFLVYFREKMVFSLGKIFLSDE